MSTSLSTPTPTLEPSASVGDKRVVNLSSGRKLVLPNRGDRTSQVAPSAPGILPMGCIDNHNGHHAGGGVHPIAIALRKRSQPRRKERKYSSHEIKFKSGQTILSSKAENVHRDLHSKSNHFGGVIGRKMLLDAIKSQCLEAMNHARKRTEERKAREKIKMDAELAAAGDEEDISEDALLSGASGPPSPVHDFAHLIFSALVSDRSF